MRLSRRAALAGLLAVPGAALAQSGAAAPAEVAAELPAAKLIGSGRLTFFGLRVYDARLWAADGFKAADYAKTPLALELQYARSLDGRQIAERSLDEMKRSGEMAADKAERWLAEMTKLFPDVGAGDRITGVLQPGTATRFFVNGKPRGDVPDADFAPRFFGIWLSPRTSEPKLRAALIGAS